MFPSALRSTVRATLLAIAASIAAPALCYAQQLPRIGVASLKLGDEASQTAHNNLGISGDMGNDFAREMVTLLTAGHKFEVIDMSSRQDLGKELAYLQSANIKAETAAKMQQEIGERMVLTGTITELSGGTEVKAFPFYKQETTKVRVVADVQVIDIETRRVVETAQGIGDKTEVKRGPNFDVKSGVATTGVPYGHGPLHEATDMAFKQIVAKLEASHYLTSPPPAPPPPPAPVARKAFTSTVADVTGNEVVFKIPTPTAAQVGDIVTIGTDRDVIDPDTGKVLKTVTTVISTGKVTEIDAANSSATAQMQPPAKGALKVRDKIHYKP